MPVFVVTMGDIIGIIVGALVILVWASVTIYDVITTKLKGK